MVGGFIQVNITQLKLLETRIDGVRNVRYVGDDLGGYEQLFSLHATLLNSESQFPFSVVNLRAVQVVVSQFDCSLYRLDQFTIDGGVSGFFEPGSPGAISELG